MNLTLLISRFEETSEFPFLGLETCQTGGQGFNFSKPLIETF